MHPIPILGALFVGIWITLYFGYTAYKYTENLEKYDPRKSKLLMFFTCVVITLLALPMYFFTDGLSQEAAMGVLPGALIFGSLSGLLVLRSSNDNKKTTP